MLNTGVKKGCVYPLKVRIQLGLSFLRYHPPYPWGRVSCWPETLETEYAMVIGLPFGAFALLSFDKSFLISTCYRNNFFACLVESVYLPLLWLRERSSYFQLSACLYLWISMSPQPKIVSVTLIFSLNLVIMKTRGYLSGQWEEAQGKIWRKLTYLFLHQFTRAPLV